MKNAQEYARRFKRLIARLRKEGGAGHASAVDDPMDQYLEGVFSNFVSEARAHATISRLRAAMVDLNELRVTPPSELVEIIGVDFPNRHAAVEALIRSLNAIYNKTHNVDLTFLLKFAKKRAESFINSLDGVSAYTKALVNLRCFGGQYLPVDHPMLAVLKKEACIPEDATVEQSQKFLVGCCKVSELPSVFLLLKRYASTHAPRKLPDPRPPAPPPAPLVPVPPPFQPSKGGSSSASAAKGKAAPGKKTPAHASKQRSESKTPHRQKTSASRRR